MQKIIMVFLMIFSLTFGDESPTELFDTYLQKSLFYESMDEIKSDFKNNISDEGMAKLDILLSRANLKKSSKALADKAGLTNEDLQKLLDFYATPLGQKVVQIDLKESGEITQNASRLNQLKKSGKYKNGVLVHELLDTIGVNKSIDITSNFLADTVYKYPKDASKQVMPKQQMIEFLITNTKIIIEPYYQMAMLDFSSKELQEVIGLYRSDAGKKEVAIGNALLQELNKQILEAH